MTDRKNYVFTVKEGVKGVTFIAAEPYNGGLDILKKGILCFDLPHGTDINKAREIANFLNENINSIAYTKLN